METVQTVRIDHASQPGMAYSQRQPPNHRPSQPDLYKPSRSPLPSPAPSRYPYPGGVGGAGAVAPSDGGGGSATGGGGGGPQQGGAAQPGSGGASAGAGGGGGPAGAPPPPSAQSQHRYMPAAYAASTYRDHAAAAAAAANVYRPSTRISLLQPGPPRTPDYGEKEYRPSNRISLLPPGPTRSPPSIVDTVCPTRIARITISPGTLRDSQYGERDYQRPRISLLQQDPSRTSSYDYDYRPARISLLPPEFAALRQPRIDQNVGSGAGVPVSGASSGQQQQQQQSQQQPGLPPSSVSIGTAPVQASNPSLAQQQQHSTAAPQSVVQQDGTQPFKKIRLQEHKEQMPPLRIDTRDQPGSYNPQVEAISPTLPDHIQEDQAFKTTKDELLQQISKVDREIAKAEAKIQLLKKKELDLEELASKPLKAAEEVEETATQPKHQSLAQKIYAENRKKAIAAHTLLGSLGPKVDWPIYNQPSDTSVYHENKRRHQIFKRRLLEYFKKRHQEKESRETYLTQTYSKLMQEWLRKVDKIEGSQKRKAKETKNREFFEKVFPELRKQREDKERFNRVGARIKSEADLEEIMDGLQEQEMEDKKMRSYAVIPPILLDAKQRKLKYINNNGHIADMENDYKERKFVNVWTNSENEIFKEKYLQHPKNFGVIASYLDRKSVQDCVQHYYLTKKQENYKQLLRKSRQRTRSSRNNPQKVNNTANNSVIDLLTTGVTTRLQREQQQKTGQNSSNTASSTLPQSQNENLTSATTTVTTNSVTSNSTTTTNCLTNVKNSDSKTILTSSCNSNSTNSTSSNVICSTTNITTTNSSSSSGGNSSSHSGGGNIQSSGNSGNNGTSGNGNGSGTGSPGLNSSEVNAEKSVKDPSENDGSNSLIKEENTLNSDQSNSSVAAENKKKKERRKDTETTDDENLENQDKSASSGICIVCKTQLSPSLQSRPLIPSQASQYNLVESDIPPNARVCNNCRCKCVRSRYTHCPLPTCPNARGRVKRLRSLPQKWQEITEELRQIVTQEFAIPPNVTKCCSACFNRIQRRLGAQEDWPDEEVNRLKMYLSEIGAVWTAIGERLGRPGHQVKSFYSANRKRFNLEACLGDRKPQLTDDDGSGSSTSSCEEPMNNRERHSSDTASAESPPVQQEAPQGAPQRKEDYDSSATETADEGQTPDHREYQSSATITVVNSDGQRQEDSSPMTVKDLMSNVIELQLMKNSGGMPHPPTTGGTPTISSILNMSNSNDVTIIGEYNLNQPQQPAARSEINLATLVTPLIAATITPVSSAPMENQIPPPREELVVLQVQEGREPEPLTLDLSIKKPRELPPPVHKHPSQIHRVSEPYIQYHHERKSPAVYVSTVGRSQPKLPSPKPANPKAGSITLGTPIITQQSRYEGLLRQMAPEAKMGSITQGTPIHIPPHLQQDKRVYDLYNKRPQPQQNQQYPQYRPSYAVEQQLSSRQIIMNDYITSQQMHGARRVEKPQQQPSTNYYSGSPHRTPPPQPQRQGVIQRHTRPNPPHPGHYPPGHEALSSLVDVAVQQPSLPVPAPHEGLGKTIADHLSEPHRFQLHQQMHQQQMRQQRIQEEQQRQRALAYREQQQQQHRERTQQNTREGSSTLTAASLIDAIITHQINQSADGGGREVVQNNREPPRPGDRLFQGFQQPENNGERSPNVIQVDLSEENQKMTVKDITDSVISMDFSQRGPVYYRGSQEGDAWKRGLPKEDKRAHTPQTGSSGGDERQIIRIAQPQKYQAVSPVSPENNHWGERNDHEFRRFQPQQQSHNAPSHISALDYVKHRIVEVMRTEDDKRDQKSPLNDKDRSDSPGDMVIDEDKQEFSNQNFAYPFSALNVQSVSGHLSGSNAAGSGDKSQGQGQGQQSNLTQNQVQVQCSVNNSVNNAVSVNNSVNNIDNVNNRTNEPKPLLSAQYEPLSDED